MSSWSEFKGGSGELLKGSRSLFAFLIHSSPAAASLSWQSRRLASLELPPTQPVPEPEEEAYTVSIAVKWIEEE